jgi:hypothetical protein
VQKVQPLAIIPRRPLNLKLGVEQENVPYNKFTRLLNCDEVRISDYTPLLFPLLRTTSRFPTKASTFVARGDDPEVACLVLGAAELGEVNRECRYFQEASKAI